MSDAVHFLNGKFVKEEELVLPVRDLGFTRGYAVFDFLITYPTQRPFMLSRHIDRLYRSAEIVGITVPYTKEEMSELVLKTLAENPGGEKAIKILVSGGVAHSLLPSSEPSVVITIDPLNPLPEELYEKGAGIITVKHSRYAPSAKTTHYIEGVKGVKAAHKVGAIEPVYYDDNRIFEGCASNIFALIDGTLMTPKSGILEGITRSVLLEILKLDVPVEVADFSREDLQDADEVFLTASNKEVLPITHIDSKPVGAGAVGAVTKDVMKQFRELALSERW